MQSNFNIDTSSLDADAFTEAGETIEDRLEEADLAQMKQEDPAAFAQETGGPGAEVQEKKPQGNDRELDDNDPRKDGVGFNLGDIGAEVTAALGGGVRDTVSSGLTLPERAGDMLSGEANEQDYDGPDWDPLGDRLNPITKTWWGGVLRSATHYLTLGGAIAGAVAASPLGAAIAGLGTVGSILVGGAVVGAGTDLISEYSQDDNAMGELKKHFPQLDNPLATKDTDSPQMKTLKNVIEGMGIGILFDAIGIGIKGLARGGKATVEEVTEAAARRGADVDEQVIEMGVKQLESPEFGAYKNQPISDPWQGSPTSRAPTVTDALEQRKRLANEWGADKTGSMDSLTTPAQLSRSTDITQMPTKDLDDFYKKAIGEESYARLVEKLTERNMNPTEVLSYARESFEGFQQMIQGRNTSDLEPEEYFELLIGKKRSVDLGIVDFGKKIVLMDLMNASNTAVMRDYAIGSRELVDVADVLDTDGPVKQIADRLRYGIEQVKTARYLWGQAGREMGTEAGAKASAEQFSLNNLKKQDKEVIAAYKREAADATNAMYQFLRRSDSNDTTKAMLEAFSMAGGPNNMEDLYSFMVKKLKGDGWNVGNATVIKELQGVMVHSVLSGPKTPVRAIMGTSTATLLRPLAASIGATLSGDKTMMREGLASLNAMYQSIPEAMKLFFSRLNGYWSGDISTVKTKNFQFDKRDQDWNAIGELIQMRKDSGKKVDFGTEAAYTLANIARGANSSNLLTYSTKLMAATDDAFGYIMARARSRQLAMRDALSVKQSGGNEFTVEQMRRYENKFMKDYVDPEGNVNFDADAALKFAREEATLTRDLSGFAKGLDTLAQTTPWIRPFMLFAKTGVNGLELTMKHMPGFNRLVADERKIMNATFEQADAGDLFDIGIMSKQDLLQAKQIQKGRQAIGAGVITMASMAFMSGSLTGNGPQDRQQRRLWTDAGWRPRSIRIGNVWVSYDSFEPFNSILSHVADIGDHYELMGPEWTEKSLFKTALVLAQSVTSKSYLAGLQQFVDLMSMEPGQGQKMIASLMNNQIPLSSLRNELGKLVNPYMKELSSDMQDSLRNRNQLTESLTGKPLPIKYDFLTGKPINDWDAPTRLFNMFSPVQFNLDYSPGKQLLFDSGYDLRVSAYSTPTGVSLKDSPEVRSLYQQAMGKQNLDKQLTELAKQPKVIESLQQMERDRNAGRHGMDPKDYYHNKVIFQLISRVQKKAWASILNEPEVQQLVEAHRLNKASSAAITRGQYGGAARTYEQAQELLNMAK